MNNKKHKAYRAPADTKQRLHTEVSAILSRCLHLFEEEVVFGDAHFDVDSAIAGRDQVRIVTERRHSPPPQMRRISTYAPLTRPSRGNFIPHGELRRA